MRIFPDSVEENRRDVARLRDWAAAGLFSKDKLAAAEESLGPGWSQSGWAIRLLLFWLGGKVQSALILFLSLFLGWQAFKEGWLLIVTGAASVAAAEFLIRRKQLYRFGVEESFAVGGVIQVLLGVLVVLGLENILRHHGLLVGGLAVSVGGLWLFARFGYLYGAFAFLLGISLMVGGLELSERETRLWLFGVYAAVLALSALRVVPKFEEESWQSLQAALVLGMAFAVNLRLERMFSTPLAPEWTAGYWASYLAVWLIPAALLGWGVKSRKRPFLIAGGLGLLVAMISNKPYLGLKRYDWDPAILGGFLMALGAGLTRWLNAGPALKRDGFTAQPIFVDRGDGLAQNLAAAAVAFQAGPGGAAPGADKPRLEGGGGSSGGAGASGSF